MEEARTCRKADDVIIMMMMMMLMTKKATRVSIKSIKTAGSGHNRVICCVNGDKRVKVERFVVC